MKADSGIEAEVLAVLKASWAAYMERDIEKVLSYYTSDPDLVAIGTGADEKYLGQESLKAGLLRDFSQAQGSMLTIAWSSVSAAGNVAWLAADCVAEVLVNFRAISIPGRLTAVFERRDDRWCIMQTHFSLAAGGQPQGQSYPGME